jgi:hypothetical protein
LRKANSWKTYMSFILWHVFTRILPCFERLLRFCGCEFRSAAKRTPCVSYVNALNPSLCLNHTN